MKKRKILQFTIASSKGGRTQYVLNNWKNINKERFQFDFVTFNPYLDFAEELEVQGCRIFRMPCYPDQDIKLFREAFGKILENDYDTLHLHTSYWKGMEVEEIAREYNVPQIIIHAHSSGYGKALDKAEVLEGQARHYEVRKQLNEGIATDYLACSEAAAEWIFGEYVPKDKIKIMRNAIDTYKFAFSEEKREEIRKKFGLENKFVLGHVGRLALPKNHEFLINVFDKVTKAIPEAVLVLVGEGELREQIENQIERLKLHDKVKLLGKREDVDVILQAMDVFLFPSLFEGFPIALVEAQTAGLPCIVSEMVTKEVQITPLIYYKPLIIDEWLEKVWDIYEKNRGKRKSMHLEVGAAGYEIKSQIKELENIYERN